MFTGYLTGFVGAGEDTVVLTIMQQVPLNHQVSLQTLFLSLFVCSVVLY